MLRRNDFEVFRPVVVETGEGRGGALGLLLLAFSRRARCLFVEGGVSLAEPVSEYPIVFDVIHVGFRLFSSFRLLSHSPLCF